MSTSASSRAWAVVEAEKKQNALLRRVSLVAWAMTFVLATIYAVLVVIEVVSLSKMMLGRNLPLLDLVAGVMPMVSSLAVVTLLIAALGSVSIFLRMRTVTLNELQLRLAALEDVLVAHSTSKT